MDHLSDADLEQRARDVFLNQALDAPAYLLLNPPATGWEGLWRDVVDEAYRRFSERGGRSFAEYIEDRCLGEWRARQCLPKSQAAAFMDRARLNGAFLVRYSRREHLEALVSRGYVEIRPASFYKDPSLNPGVIDDELRLAIRPNPSEYTVTVLDRHTRLPKGRLDVIDSVITAVAPSNYYVYCLSGLLAPHLLYDFGADACVVIHQPKVFLRRLWRAMYARFPLPAWGGKVERVLYVDPLNTGVKQFLIYFAKHFRFAYQYEYRFVWCPAVDDVSELNVIRLELGDMEDCCALVCA